MTFSRYDVGLTIEKVGEIFEEIFEELYGYQYSKNSVSRMFDYAREEVLL